MKERIKKLQASLQEESLGAYLVTNSYNLRYMTGFTGTSGLALVTTKNAYFITDFRYTEQAKLQCQGYEVIEAGGSASHSSPLRLIQELLQENGVSQLGYEEQHVTVAQFDDFENVLEVQLVPASGMIEVLRQVKDADEIDKIKKACEITDKAFEYILGYIKPGISEIDIANTLDFKMREFGASGISFDTIVASGKRSAMPHGVAMDKLIANHELITIDFGCYYQGYCSDMTRTVAVGQVDSTLEKIYQIVFDANRMVQEALKPGMTGQELDAIARDYIEGQGYGKNFGHSLGHSIGLEVHEAPMAGPNSKNVLKADQFITDEPGIYLENLGGVRIEDDLLIHEDGNEYITKSPRELIVL
ncbi:M24 family metallopeptidase [Aerococcus sp. Group 2]|uniref:M24 family metallopeptidase n=1 Tax=Aerococcus sp. Group 2 TaxID=2976811 RepID=UPI00227A26D5|nr:aminopeptidase P family protein [Aerococcus sp. Group 2]MCY3036096.1 aminopeptidase P family protein [Aerococcus sp. Group 2]